SHGGIVTPACFGHWQARLQPLVKSLSPTPPQDRLLAGPGPGSAGRPLPGGCLPWSQRHPCVLRREGAPLVLSHVSILSVNRDLNPSLLG
uniref:Uncharacterized protein n=1 Tax=Triticum urartu TaxID=4572 RepID=A0A8R7UFJ7_TRIUA